MKVSELVDKLDLKILAGEKHDKEVTGIYTCDLLSWAMARIKTGYIWVTVHTHLNVVAVSALTEASCVIVPEGIEVPQETIKKANSQDVIILTSEKSAADICIEFSKFFKSEYN